MHTLIHRYQSFQVNLTRRIIFSSLDLNEDKKQGDKI